MVPGPAIAGADVGDVDLATEADWRTAGAVRTAAGAPQHGENVREGCCVGCPGQGQSDPDPGKVRDLGRPTEVL